MIGMRELIIILLVVLVIFGTKKLRTIGSDLGGAVRGFKKAMSDGEAEGEQAAKQIKQSVGVDAEFPESKAPSTSTPSSNDRQA
jgi:sec-independent protein translocase protein TatA